METADEKKLKSLDLDNCEVLEKLLSIVKIIILNFGLHHLMRLSLILLREYGVL